MASDATQLKVSSTLVDHIIQLGAKTFLITLFRTNSNNFINDLPIAQASKP